MSGLAAVGTAPPLGYYTVGQDQEPFGHPSDRCRTQLSPRPPLPTSDRDRILPYHKGILPITHPHSGLRARLAILIVGAACIGGMVAFIGLAGVLATRLVIWIEGSSASRLLPMGVYSFRAKRGSGSRFG